MSPEKLFEGLVGGDARALARAISLVEDEAPQARELMEAAYRRSGRALVIGITGASGVGKSTLVDALGRVLRSRGKKVGILAVDPTSPYTGGAILGDRVRMRAVGSDPGVFIRSLATRGQLGGLSRATGQAMRLLDCAGYDAILIETVGAGQGEVEVMRYAHTTLVVLVPGLGDEIQAIKAGILEIGDIFVVNKADLEGAERVALELQMMIEMSSDEEERGWVPPIYQTVARDGVGVDDLLDGIETHHRYLSESGRLERLRLQQAEAELRDFLVSYVLSVVRDSTRESGLWEELCRRIAANELDPYAAVSELVEEVAPALTGDGRRGAGPSLERH